MKSITLFFSITVKLLKCISSHNFCSIVTKLGTEHLQTVLNKTCFSDFWLSKNWSYSAWKRMTVNSTVNVYHQILDKYIFNLPEKNWEYSGVMVDEVCKYQNFISKLNFWEHFEFCSHGNNCSQCESGIFKPHIFSYEAKHLSLKTNHQHFHAVKMQFMYYQIFV